MGKKSWQGKVAVVTGGASGIGRAVCRRLGSLGCRVYLVDIDRIEGRQAASECGGTFIEADCSESRAMAEAAGRIEAEAGPADFVFANAGVCFGGEFELLDDRAWEQSFAVNFWGVLNTVRAFLPAMEARGKGTLVFTASMAGLTGLPMVAPYCSSKFAVVGLAQTLAIELRRKGIRVVCVCPGAVRSRVLRKERMQIDEGWYERVEKLVSRHSSDPERAARKIVNAAGRGKPLVIVSAGGLRLLWWLRRILPGGIDVAGGWLLEKTMHSGSGKSPLSGTARKQGGRK
ncbi:MAG: SDR family oxidoreductase [Deltaproteobacteria bacterium]|nr:MAG: SDR family oxidoreductase [Deltaproteobacteria bacterium]